MTHTPHSSAPSRPKGVRAVRARRADGTTATYWYCRLTGTRLPDPADPNFATALAAARRPQIAGPMPGTLGALLAEWRASPEWAATARATKAGRERYLAFLEIPEWANRPVAGLTRAELLRLRDTIATERGNGAATVFGQALAAALSWGVDRGLLPYNPLARLKALDLGHIPPWTEAQAQHAMAVWPEHLRRAVVLAYELGQRRGDLSALMWSDYDEAGRVILMQPEKTRRRRERRGLGPLRLPVSDALAAELASWKAGRASTHILTNSDGRPWRKGALAMAIHTRLAAEGWDTRMGLHGLRKLRAGNMVERGASTSEIAAAIGWSSLAHVELYTRGADQERLARAALARLETGLSKTGKGDGK